jgi:hypothetical protein
VQEMLERFRSGATTWSCRNSSGRRSGHVRRIQRIKVEGTESVHWCSVHTQPPNPLDASLPPTAAAVGAELLPPPLVRSFYRRAARKYPTANRRVARATAPLMRRYRKLKF